MERLMNRFAAPDRNTLLVTRALSLGLALCALCARLPQSGSAAPASFGSGLDICTPPVRSVTPVDPTVVTDCTQDGLQAALEDGGHITFACGPGPVTIPLTGQLELNTDVDTVIDGGGTVTLDGQGRTRILYKGWHDPDLGTVTITLQNLRLINGRAPGGGSTGEHSGGAINVGHPGTRLHVIDTTFEANTTTDITTADNQGGAIFVGNAYETVISGAVFRGNSAGSGGAFGGIATGLFVVNSTFEDNRALDDTTAPGVVRGYGGALHLDGVANSYNPASNKRVHICGSSFLRNSAVRGGGATVVTVSDDLGTRVTYERSTFEANEVTGIDGAYGQGGAIYHIEDDHAGGTHEKNVEILRSTFHANRAGRQGGGVWLYILGRGEITNCTFEANTTTAPFDAVGQGGAAAITLGHFDVLNTTFAHNHAAYQAGALHGGGSTDPNRVVTLTNTIFYSNTLNIGQTEPSETKWQGFHTNRQMNDGGQNIQYPRYKPVYDNDVNNLITANPIFDHPRLAPLADNGGPHATMALQAGSPAIDAGTAPCPATDQRGVARQGPCDIGAYEYVSRLLVTPEMRRVAPGQATTYVLEVPGALSASEPFTLAATAPDAEVTLEIRPLTVKAGETAVMTVTDHHAGPTLVPGRWYRLPITATGTGLTLSAEVRLLVGGARLYLPATLQSSP